MAGQRGLFRDLYVTLDLLASRINFSLSQQRNLCFICYLFCVTLGEFILETISRIVKNMKQRSYDIILVQCMMISMNDFYT